MLLLGLSVFDFWYFYYNTSWRRRTCQELGYPNFVPDLGSSQLLSLYLSFIPPYPPILSKVIIHRLLLLIVSKISSMFSSLFLFFFVLMWRYNFKIHVFYFIDSFFSLIHSAVDGLIFSFHLLYSSPLGCPLGSLIWFYHCAKLIIVFQYYFPTFTELSSVSSASSLYFLKTPIMISLLGINCRSACFCVQLLEILWWCHVFLIFHVPLNCCLLIWSSSRCLSLQWLFSGKKYLPLGLLGILRFSQTSMDTPLLRFLLPITAEFLHLYALPGLCNLLKQMLTVFLLTASRGIPDHLTCLFRNLYAAQEATVRTGHGTTVWFQTGTGVCQGYILSLCLFNLHTENIIKNKQTNKQTNKTLGWKKHKLESRLLGEISITSGMQMTPPLWQKVKKN